MRVIYMQKMLTDWPDQVWPWHIEQWWMDPHANCFFLTANHQAVLPLVVWTNSPDMPQRLPAHPHSYYKKIHSVLAKNQNTAKQVSEVVTNFQAQN